MQMSDIVTSVQPVGALPEAQLLKLFTYLASKGASTEEDEKADLGFPTKPRSGWLKKWTFSTTLKGSTVTLAEKNSVATNSSAIYGYVVGDIGFSKGKHAWRTTIRSLGTSNQWILIGVASKKTFTDNSSYNDTSLNGMTSCSNVYKAGVAVSLGGSSLNLRNGEIIDVLLDVDTKRLQYATSNGQTAIISDIAQDPTGQYAPHYILYQNNSIKVEAISVSKFGKF